MEALHFRTNLLTELFTDHISLSIIQVINEKIVWQNYGGGEEERQEQECQRQEVVKVEMVAGPALDDLVVEEKTSARMKLAGKLSCS